MLQQNASVNGPNQVGTSIPFARKWEQMQYLWLSVLFGDQKPNKINNNMPLSVSRMGFVMIEDMKQRYSRLTVVPGVHTSEVFHIGVRIVREHIILMSTQRRQGNTRHMLCIINGFGFNISITV